MTLIKLNLKDSSLQRKTEKCVVVMRYKSKCKLQPEAQKNNAARWIAAAVIAIK